MKLVYLYSTISVIFFKERSNTHSLIAVEFENLLIFVLKGSLEVLCCNHFVGI